MLLWTPVLRDDQHRHMAVLVVGLNVFCLGVITEDVHTVNIEYSNCTYPFPPGRPGLQHMTLNVYWKCIVIIWMRIRY